MASSVADRRDGTAVSSEREERLAELVVSLADENANLQRALDTRVVIEQAKGVLAERHGINMTQAFEPLRRFSRDNNIKLTEHAMYVVRDSTAGG